MPGSTGATSRPAFTPAAVSLARARSRTAGIGDRASSARINSTSSVVRERWISRSLRSWIRSRRSVSRATSGLLVIRPTGEPFAAGQAAKHAACDPKSPLGGLIGIGGRADDDRSGGVGSRLDRAVIASQVGVERTEYLLFDEDALLERLPTVRSAELVQLGVGQPAGVVRTLHHIAVSEAGVAVRAAEFTPDVGVERPKVHSGLLWRVEHRPGLEREELRAAQSFVEYGERATPRRRRREQQLGCD